MVVALMIQKRQANATIVTTEVPAVQLHNKQVNITNTNSNKTNAIYHFFQEGSMQAIGTYVPMDFEPQPLSVPIKTALPVGFLTMRKQYEGEIAGQSFT